MYDENQYGPQWSEAEELKKLREWYKRVFGIHVRPTSTFGGCYGTLSKCITLKALKEIPKQNGHSILQIG